MRWELKTQIDVDAPASLAWTVLSDFAAYPEWNPFILAVDGRAAVGPMRYRFQFPAHGPRIWTNAVILQADPDRELRWAAHFLSPRVFNGDHHCIISPSSDASFTFHHGEVFTGTTLPVMLPILKRLGPRVYESLNVAFKARVESLR